MTEIQIFMTEIQISCLKFRFLLLKCRFSLLKCRYALCRYELYWNIYIYRTGGRDVREYQPCPVLELSTLFLMTSKTVDVSPHGSKKRLSTLIHMTPVSTLVHLTLSTLVQMELSTLVHMGLSTLLQPPFLSCQVHSNILSFSPIDGRIMI
jgi:hypothetical protein